jgi:tetratricopeptide (TPR) repeat protein
MADVFISYRNTPDRRAIVRRLATILRAYEVTVWWDYGLEAGESYRSQIMTELTNARIVMPLWCAESVQSQWVRMEAELGKDKLLPARLQKVAPPDSFEAIQAADLIGWDGAVGNPRLQAFVRRVCERLGRQPVVATDMIEELANLPPVQPLPAVLLKSSDPSASVAPINASSPSQTAETITVSGTTRSTRRRSEVRWVGAAALAMLVLAVAIFAYRPHVPETSKDDTKREEVATAKKKSEQANRAAEEWRVVKDTTSPQTLDSFIRHFGDTYYGDLAKARLAELKTKEARDLAQKAKAYVDRGIAYYEKGNYDLAVAEFDTAITIHPGYAEAYRWRGRAVWGPKICLFCVLSQTDYDRIYADFSKAIEINPRYADAYYSRGVLQQSVPDLSKAIEINPDHVGAYQARANRYQSKAKAAYVYDDETGGYVLQGVKGGSDFAAAISDLTHVIRLNPNPWLAYNERGRLYFGNGDYDLAISDWLKVIELANADWTLPGDIGDAYLAKRKYDLALAQYDKLPKDYAHHKRGKLHFSKGDYDLAISEFNKALDMAKDYSPKHGYFYWRGRAYEAKGQSEKAITDYRQAASIYGGKGWQELQDRLKRLGVEP